MTIANVHEAKTNLGKLLDGAAEGKEVMITRRGGDFKLTPVHPNQTKRATFSAYMGKITFAPDYVAADQEIAELFEESASD